MSLHLVPAVKPRFSMSNNSIFGAVAAAIGLLITIWSLAAYSFASKDAVNSLDSRLSRLEDKLDRILERLPAPRR